MSLNTPPFDLSYAFNATSDGFDSRKAPAGQPVNPSWSVYLLSDGLVEDSPSPQSSVLSPRQASQVSRIAIATKLLRTPALGSDVVHFYLAQANPVAPHNKSKKILQPSNNSTNTAARRITRSTVRSNSLCNYFKLTCSTSQDKPASGSYSGDATARVLPRPNITLVATKHSAVEPVTPNFNNSTQLQTITIQDRWSQGTQVVELKEQELVATAVSLYWSIGSTARSVYVGVRASSTGSRDMSPNTSQVSKRALMEDSLQVYPVVCLRKGSAERVL
ncbi:hypothetical protein CVT26_002292 [Gymnopilus dilepis]|uniref:Uncharacterized protein n=1 Tax=Gymnopilus dilepis TaxID=231916 RepID=A0A409YN41_9AGAR|nr:hypothetical protein CVT26_002292 [Gymnopilus dilepis]